MIKFTKCKLCKGKLQNTYEQYLDGQNLVQGKPIAQCTLCTAKYTSSRIINTPMVNIEVRIINPTGIYVIYYVYEKITKIRMGVTMRKACNDYTEGPLFIMDNLKDFPLNAENVEKRFPVLTTFS